MWQLQKLLDALWENEEATARDKRWALRQLNEIQLRWMCRLDQAAVAGVAPCFVSEVLATRREMLEQLAVSTYSRLDTMLLADAVGQNVDEEIDCFIQSLPAAVPVRVEFYGPSHTGAKIRYETTNYGGPTSWLLAVCTALCKRQGVELARTDFFRELYASGRLYWEGTIAQLCGFQARLRIDGGDLHFYSNCTEKAATLQCLMEFSEDELVE